METIEFDTAYSAVTGERTGDYVPTVESDDAEDVLIDGMPPAYPTEDGWHALTGYTRQYGYRGAVMHPSETADDDTIREWVRDAGGDVFAIVTVEAPCTPDDQCNHAPAGWAVIYRTIPA